MKVQGRCQPFLVLGNVNSFSSSFSLIISTSVVKKDWKMAECIDPKHTPYLSVSGQVLVLNFASLKHASSQERKVTLNKTQTPVPISLGMME